MKKQITPVDQNKIIETIKPLGMDPSSSNAIQLSNLYLERAFGEAISDSTRSIKVIDIIRYADYIVILAHNVNNLQTLVRCKPKQAKKPPSRRSKRLTYGFGEYC